MGLAVPIIAGVATVASTVQNVQAARKQAAIAGQQATVAQQVADYNAKLDEANAEQLALTSQANIERQRQEGSAYLSNQRAAYAASGILSGTGSPLAVQATTAGRLETDIQNYWFRTQQEESNLYSAAQMERFGGANQAAAYRAEAQAFKAKAMGDIFTGIGSVAKIGGDFATKLDQRAAANNPYGTSTFRDYKPWTGWDSPSPAIGAIA